MDERDQHSTLIYQYFNAIKQKYQIRATLMRLQQQNYTCMVPKFKIHSDQAWASFPIIPFELIEPDTAVP